MELGERLDPGDAFRQQVHSLLDARARITESIASGQSDALAEFDIPLFTAESLANTSPTDFFVTSALVAETFLKAESKEEVAARLAAGQEFSAALKNIYTEEQLPATIREIFATSKKPLTDILASEASDEFFVVFTTLSAVSGDARLEELPDKFVNAYLAETGALQSRLMMSDEVMESTVNADVERSLRNPREIAVQMDWLASKGAIKLMLEAGWLDQDDRHFSVMVDTDKSQPAGQPTVRLQSLDQSPDANMIISELFSESSGLFSVTRRTLIIYKEHLGKKDDKVVESEILSLGQEGLLFVWLDYLAKAYQELEALGPKHLRQEIRQVLFSS